MELSRNVSEDLGKGQPNDKTGTFLWIASIESVTCEYCFLPKPGIAAIY